MTFVVKDLLNDFPILQKRIRGKRLAYLDNAATTQKPKRVLDSMMHYYTEQNANIHRGVHTLSAMATESYEGPEKWRKFLEKSFDAMPKEASKGVNPIIVVLTWGYVGWMLAAWRVHPGSNMRGRFTT